MEKTKKSIKNQKIIAIIRGIEKDKIYKVVNALIEGGISCIEITLVPGDNKKTNEKLNIIHKLNTEFDNICLGAGTVIKEDHVKMAIDSGAEYIISPNTDPKIIDKTKFLGKTSIPGASTPTEVIKAYQSGADFIKFFPAVASGVLQLKALQGPIPHIPLLAVGGIKTDNVESFINAGAVGVGVGGGLIDKTAIHEENYEVIKNKAKTFLKLLKHQNTNK